MSDVEKPEANGGEREQKPEFINIEDSEVERLSQDKGLLGFALGAALFEESLHREEGEPESGRTVELFHSLYQGTPYEEAAKVHPNCPKDFKYYIGLVAGEYFGSQENYEKGIVSDKYKISARRGSIVSEGTIFNFERWSRNAASSRITGARSLITLYEKAWEKAEVKAKIIESGKDRRKEAA